MKFAVLCSAGGSSFFAAYDILQTARIFNHENFILVTDRPCDAEEQAKERKIECKRIPFESKEQFSKDAANYLIEHKITALLMLYSRLVTSDLYFNFPTLNIHPALLPAFKGIGAVRQALDFGSKFIGATLHFTTERMDDGDIVCQVISPISVGVDRLQLERLSFLQKSYLILVALDAFRLDIFNIHSNFQGFVWGRDMEFTSSANPCIPSLVLRNSFDDFQLSLGMPGAIK